MPDNTTLIEYESSVGYVDQFCRNCGREKKYHFDPAYGGMTVEYCPECSGVVGWIKRKLGLIDRVSPVPESPRISRAAKAHRQGELTKSEFDTIISEELGVDNLTARITHTNPRGNKDA